ncbi:hypothetical protein FQN55_006149 [Onygenales sp. PD_40]|nr:hypothetical protein FQN55_006149 [Onygenales sp. PD_40]
MRKKSRQHDDFLELTRTCSASPTNTSTLLARPDAEFRDPERIEIISWIANRAQIRTADSVAYACIWLANIENLRAIRNSPDPNRAIRKLRSLNAFEAVKMWLQKSVGSSATGSARGSAPASTATSLHGSSPAAAKVTPSPRSESKKSPSAVGTPKQNPSASGKRKADAAGITDEPRTLKARKTDQQGKRSERAKNLCRQRDLSACVLTRMDILDVAHVYPFCMNKLESSEIFWETLKVYWTEEQVNAWKAAVSGPMGTETVENLLCFSPDAHRLHGRARFALHLESFEGETNWQSMNLSFHWLKAGQKGNIILTQTPSLLAEKPVNYGLTNYEIKHDLISGDPICLESTDPETMPLPHARLMELQWLLSRVAALSGAADFLELSGDDDDDGDGWGLPIDVESESSADTPPTPSAWDIKQWAESVEDPET